MTDLIIYSLTNSSNTLVHLVFVVADVTSAGHTLRNPKSNT